MFNPLNLISKIIKGSNQKELDRIQKKVRNINLLEKDVEKLKDLEFPKKTMNSPEVFTNFVEMPKNFPDMFKKF